MKILIIGCRGQLGKDCSQLLSEKHTTICFDTPQIDIGDNNNIVECIEGTRPDAIINCAAYTAVDMCETEKEICWRINADGPKYLAQAASRLNSRLIHISTDYVFDGSKTPPNGYTEDDQTNPLSEYGRSKLAGEQAVEEYCENHLILRTAWLYSAHGKNFLKTMLRLALQDPERTIKVVNDQHGSLTWSATLAQQITRLLETDLRGTFHATAKGHSTWYEGACNFLRAMEVPFKLLPCTTSEYPTPAKRPLNSILNNNKLDDLGISCFPHWEDDIDHFTRTHKDQLINEYLDSSNESSK